ncbi:MAG: pilus assembly protein PilP [Desulfotignum sp.]|nr:pilus assembly protein PilP [Desulfotignum sp.]
MKHLTHTWLLIMTVMLGVSITVCGKTTATEAAGTSPVPHAIPRSSAESAGTSPVRHAMPRSSEAEKIQLPVTENGSGEPAPKQTAAVQNLIPAEGIEMADDIFDGADQSYEAISSLDPFAPLIQEDPPASPEPRKPEKPRRILTPLEKMTLNQLKLVAVVMGENRKIAMVEEASGKGYEVSIGTYMGKNQGQVVDIQFDRIVVRETAVDVNGIMTERFQELKPHKADSGE